MIKLEAFDLLTWAINKLVNVENHNFISEEREVPRVVTIIGEWSLVPFFQIYRRSSRMLMWLYFVTPLSISVRGMFTGMLKRRKQLVMFSQTTVIEIETPKNSETLQIAAAHLIYLVLIVMLPVLVYLKLSIFSEFAIFFIYTWVVLWSHFRSVLKLELLTKMLKLLPPFSETIWSKDTTGTDGCTKFVFTFRFK